MKQYRRMICYLYEYIGGEKGQNVGYVRLEQRGEQCRVQLQMRVGDAKTLPEVQLFKKRTSGMYILPVGNVQEQKGQWVYRLEGESDHLLGTDCSLEEMDGVILPVDEKYYYASTWNLETIPMGERNLFPTTTLVAEQESAFATTTPQTMQSQMTEKPVPMEKQKPEEEMETTVGYESEELDAAEWSSDTACVEEKTSQASLESLMELFPKMMPFGNQTDWECVRFEPKDIGCLPMKLWFVSGNPFLMQGYYNYRHLILTKMQETQYGLGVPGIFTAEMKKQAEQSGFPMFRSICGNRNCPGAFGYWLMPLELG